MKNSIKNALLGSALLLTTSLTCASTINVGGVNWDPDSVFSYPAVQDFEGHGTIYETFATQVGDTVTGFGIVTHINSASANEALFCPSCDLTFTFSMDLKSVTPFGPTFAGFEFENYSLNFYSQAKGTYQATEASSQGTAQQLWLSLAGNATSGLLTGTGTNILSASATGSGTILLDVTGGMAASNFDTNEELHGADLFLSSSFGVAGGGANAPLSGTVDIFGNSIPEPTSLALLGLGLLGFGAAKRRKA